MTNKDLNKTLAEKNRQLRKENEELKNAVNQTQRMLDAIVIELCIKYGGDEKTLVYPIPDLSGQKHVLTVDMLTDTHEFKVRPVLREELGEE